MGGALFPTEDQRRDHFPVLCCMRAERHLASIPQGSGAEHVAISVRQCPQLNWIVDPPPRVYGTHVNVRFGSLADIMTSPRHVRFTLKLGCASESAFGCRFIRSC